MQKIKNNKDAYLAYEELFKLDVISNHYYEEEDYIRGLQNGNSNTIIDELNYLSPNVKSLRYLVFRNRAFLYYEILKSGDETAIVMLDENFTTDNLEDKRKEYMRELFYSMIDDMIVSLIYQEADEKLLNTLYEIFAYLNITKLARNTLEYIISGKDESDDLFGLLPINNSVKHKYELLLKSLHLSKSSIDEVDIRDDIDRINRRLSFLEPIKIDYQKLIEKTRVLREISVDLESKQNGLEWTSVIDDINKKIKNEQDKEKYQEVPRIRTKDLNPYLLSENPIERVKFNFPLLQDTACEDEIPSDNENNNEAADESEVEIDDEKTVIPFEESKKDDGEEEIFYETKEFTEEENKPTEKTELSNSFEIKIDDNEELKDMSRDAKENPQDEKARIDGNETYKQTRVIQRSSKRVKHRNEEATVEINDFEVTRSCFVETEKFFEVLNQYFEVFNREIGTDLHLENIVNKYVPPKVDNHADESETVCEPYEMDFLVALNDWNTKAYTQSLFMDDDIPIGPSTNQSTENEKIKLMEVLSTFGNKNNSSKLGIYKDVFNITEYETTNEILQFLRQLNEVSCHYEELKIKILRRLLGTQHRADEVGLISELCLISDSIWDSKLFEKIKEWVIQHELVILHYLQVDTKNNIPEHTMFEKFSFSVSIYEILVDTYISLKTHINNMTSSSSKRSIHKSNKSTINSLSLDLVKLGDKINRWTLFFENLLPHIRDKNNQYYFKCYSRYKWSFIQKEKSQSTIWQEKGFILSQLQELLDSFYRFDSKIILFLPNYENINEISVENIKNQLTTTSILSILSKILYAKPGTNNDEAIQLLETILIKESMEEQPSDTLSSTADHKSFDQNALTAIKSFLEESPVDMKLSSWNILFLYYDENKQFAKFQYGFERNLEFLLNYLNSDSYKLLATSKLETLMKILGSYGKHVKIYLNHLCENGWKLTDSHRTISDIERTFKGLLKLFELFYMFSLHEEAALISSLKLSVKARSNKSYEKLKDMFIGTASVIVIYYKELLMLKAKSVGNKNLRHLEYVIGTLVCDLHEQLGWRKVCDSANGLLLNLSQDILVSFNYNSFENQLSQLICCRYHYSVSIDNYIPANHETKKTAEFDLAATQELSKFVLPLCFKRNPLTHTPKSDIKLLIEEFYEVIGDPDFESCEVLSRNDSLFEHFLESTSISSRFLRDSFYGLEELDFEVPSKNTSIIQSGLYYMQGLLMFSSYKIRKKSTQSRAVELESVIKLLKNDLIYCTKREESWLLLGQAYAFLVEDDLIWTSDKLTVPERKIGTANLQRKSLICYLMAINESSKADMKDENPQMKTTIGLLMSSFTKDMYNAVMKPMDMHAFRVQNNPRFIRKSNGATFVNIAPTSAVKLNLCLRVIQQSLHLAIKSKPSDWTFYYYLSKVQKKLKKSPKFVLETLEHASLLAKDQSNPSDPIIEPHYKKCSLVYKYVRDDFLDIETALLVLEKDPIIKFQKSNNNIENKKQFYEVIVDSLKKVIVYDKKRWHHKPKYRLAKILFDEFDNVKEAKDEISSIVSLKASNKTLVLIWKPEHERPGKHFHYTFQYALFYVILLTEEHNLINLIQMLPKLRRSNSIMISLYSVWETLCSSICKIIRRLLDVDNIFTERFMLPLAYQKFMVNTKALLDIMKEKGIPKELEIHLCFLHAITDMKKLNNGFGPTSLIDDTMIAIFIRIYLHFDRQQNNPLNIPEHSESPGEKVKKLAKRDFFPLISDMLKSFRRNIENILKEEPEFYNKFVKKTIESHQTGNNNLSFSETEPKEMVLRTPEPQRDNYIESVTSDVTPFKNNDAISSGIEMNKNLEEEKHENNENNESPVSTAFSRVRTLDNMYSDENHDSLSASPSAKKVKPNSDEFPPNLIRISVNADENNVNATKTGGDEERS